MQIIICGLLEKIICLNNGHIRHSVCSILHTASELITNVHAKEAQRLEEMKGRSEKRKERKAKLSSKDAGFPERGERGGGREREREKEK